LEQKSPLYILMMSAYCLLGASPVPHICNDIHYIGDSCNISMELCGAFKPCENLGYCTNDPNLLYGYSCMYKPGFNGNNCEFDIRLCQSNTCLYNGNLSVGSQNKYSFLFEVPERNWIIQIFIVIAHKDIRVFIVNFWLTIVMM